MKTLQTILLVGVVIAATLIGCWAYTQALYVTTCFAVVAVVAVTAVLCIARRRSVAMMEQLLASLSVHDYSLAFREESRTGGTWHSGDIDALARDINRVVEQYKQREVEVHTRLRYFETLLGCIDTTLIVATPEGAVQWTNRAGEKLLGYVPRHIDELAVLTPALLDTLQLMQPGHTASLTLRKGTPQEMQTVVDVSLYTTGKQTLRLYTLRNIREVLEGNEMESWQKLIRVLTHEIMNSLTPILSLSETLEGYLVEDIEEYTPACHSEQSEITFRSPLRQSRKQYGLEILRVAQDDNKKTKSDNTESAAILRQGLQTIHRRSNGLLEFMKNYRKVSLLPQPICSDVSVSELVEPLKPLFVSTEAITYCFGLSHPETVLHIDRTLMEQVLINLLKNAAEACAHTPHAVVALTDEFDECAQCYRLHVTDNGPGILPEVQEKIFIPFFTTKPQGAGIGLALSRQIVRQHRGTLRVTSVEGNTRFTVEMWCRDVVNITSG